MEQLQLQLHISGWTLCLTGGKLRPAALTDDAHPAAIHTLNNTTQLLLHSASSSSRQLWPLKVHHDQARFVVCWWHGQTCSAACVMNRQTAQKPSILPLPQEVVAQIRSSSAIVSLTGVVLELLKNSLDAKATKVDATIDFARGTCTVEDDGLGIPPLEFREEGGLGKLYCTQSTYRNSENRD
jgi:hypothetical protein